MSERAAAPVAASFPLFVGLPSRVAALAQQKSNLHRFVREHAAQYAALPYHPWTRPVAGVVDTLVDIGASTLPGCEGYRGVFARREVLPTAKKQQLLSYGGLLMTESMYEEFARQYHCPTALGLPELRWTDPHTRVEHNFVVVGDPTQPGAIINDGVRSGVPANCVLESVAPAHRSRAVSKPDAHGKCTVSTQIAAVWVLSHTHIRAGQELTLDYDNGAGVFWSPTFEPSPHCASCFARRTARGDQLLQCQGVVAGSRMRCPASRHRLCFPADEQPQLRRGAAQFYCPNHLSAAAEAPRKRRRVALPQADPCTPPPVISLQTACEFPAAAAALAAADSPGDAAAASVDHGSRAAADSCAPSSPARYDYLTPPPTLRLQLPSPVRSAGASVPAKRSLGFERPLRQPPLAVVVELENEGDGGPSRSDTPEPWQLSPAAPSESHGEECAARKLCTQRSASSEAALASPQEQHEHQLESRSLLVAAAQAKPHRAIPVLHVRNRSAACKLDNYAENYGLLSVEQCRQLQFASEEHQSRSTWSRPRKKRAARQDASHAGSSPMPSVAAASVHVGEAGLPTPIFADAVQTSPSSQPSPACSSGDGAQALTASRYRDWDLLRHDWAEYRSCCGKAVQWRELHSHNVDAHSSHSIVKMFRARLDFMRRAGSQLQFADNVRALLLDSTGDKVQWMGGPVCLSCLRAVLGRGKNWFRKVLRAPDEHLRSKFTNITAGGAVRTPRAAVKSERVLNLLREYSKLMGHHRPNPEHKSSKFHTYLPHKQLSELADALSSWEMVKTKAAELRPVHMSRLKAAREMLLEEEGHHISLGSKVSLMRCATCDMLDNMVTASYIKENRRTLQEVNADRLQKKLHIATMQRQRAFFDQLKDQAMSSPEELWCLTLDGMDQSKTQLPHQARLNKITDALARLKVHAEGGFCFGGPVPIMGLLNFADLRKDASLCVMTVERMLDIQWAQLEEHYKERQQVAACKEQQRAEAAEQDSQLAAEMKDEAAAAPSVHPSEHSSYPDDGVGMKWPRRLHITFDNAAGECKNQWMFRYLGLLVLHGVVQYVTVSNLLVGHTHDIVDQLFSIWARMLRLQDALTLSAMKKIFHERYVTRIQGLVNLMKKRHQERDGLSSEEQEAFEEMQHSSAESAADWSSAAGNILQEFTKFVRATFPNVLDELAPHIELQQESLDVQGWLQRAVRAEKLPALEFLSEAYNFGIEKDDNGDVYLYNKHLCDSETVAVNSQGLPITHRYMHQATGHYTARALLYKADDGQLADPYRIPPLHLDVEKMRHTAAKYREIKLMSAAQWTEFDAMLTRFDDAQKHQRQLCSECSDLAAAYCGIGVVHRAHGADEADRQAANQKTRSRDSAWKALREHLYDPLFAIQHRQGQVMANWWRKWLARVDEHIFPAYVARSLVVDTRHPTANFYDAHPDRLCTNGDEAPWLVQPARVDLSWLRSHGVPRPGQMAVVRAGDDVREPFYMAEIVRVRPLNQRATQEIAHAEVAEAAEHTEAATAHTATGASASAAAPCTATGAARRRGSGKARCAAMPISADVTLKEFEVTVRYWDYLTKDFDERLHLCAEKDLQAKKQRSRKWWADQFSKHNDDFDAATAALNASKALQQKPPAVRPWLADMHKNVSFISSEADMQAEVTISGAMLIIWGALDTILCPHSACPSSRGGKAWRVKAPHWRSVWQDLTEQLMPLRAPRQRQTRRQEVETNSVQHLAEGPCVDAIAMQDATHVAAAPSMPDCVAIVTAPPATRQRKRQQRPKIAARQPRRLRSRRRKQDYQEQSGSDGGHSGGDGNRSSSRSSSSSSTDSSDSSSRDSSSSSNSSISSSNSSSSSSSNRRDKTTCSMDIDDDVMLSSLLPTRTTRASAGEAVCRASRYRGGRQHV
jgi:hypothetical protein